MPKFSKGHNSRKKFRFFFESNQFIYSSSSISRLSLNIIAQIVFEISRLQDFIAIICKGHNSRKGHNPDKKENMGQLFFVPRLFEEKWRDTVFGFTVVRGAWRVVRGAWRVVRGSEFLVGTLSP